MSETERSSKTPARFILGCRRDVARWVRLGSFERGIHRKSRINVLESFFLELATRGIALCLDSRLEVRDKIIFVVGRGTV